MASRVPAIKRFRIEMEREIIRRIKEGTYYITREDVEQIGAQTGVEPRGVAVTTFAIMKGDEWQGTYGHSNETKEWTEVFFYPEWFQKTGRVRSPGQERPY
jgi:hypothetical protein